MMPALTQIANLFVTQAKDMANQVRAPSNIQGAFYIDSPQQLGENFYIDVHIDLKIAPAAAAYEWGSGIHATRQKPGGGPPDEYPIPYKPTGVAFPSSRWPNYNPPPGKGIPNYFYFAQISHPGVAPRPYIIPTLQNHFQEYVAMIAGGLIAQIFIDSPQNVIIEVRL